MSDSPHRNTSLHSEGNCRELFVEKMLSMSQAARMLPSLRGGKTPHPNTLIRWAKAGLKSKGGRIIRLETYRIGGTTCTSLNALRQFFDLLNDVEPTTSPVNFSEGSRVLTEQAMEARDILIERGMLDL
jgi:hypothetical protein